MSTLQNAITQPLVGWQPIETAPEDTLVVVTGLDYGRGPNRHFEIAIKEVNWGWVSSDGGGLEFLTHWMPLPEPPKGE